MPPSADLRDNGIIDRNAAARNRLRSNVVLFRKMDGFAQFHACIAEQPAMQRGTPGPTNGRRDIKQHDGRGAVLIGGLAEGMRFELTVGLDTLQRFSKPPPSATRPPLRRERTFPEAPRGLRTRRLPPGCRAWR